jgi:outer membrane usher protein FimD/PapC
MPRLARVLLCLLALTMTVGAAAGAAATGGAELDARGTPPGFDALAAPRVTLVDVYFGGRKIGETLADTQPGSLRFRTPAEVLAMLPDVIAAPALASSLAKDLPTNSSALCSLAKTTGCGILAPPVLAIIYDEDQFRVDLFINPGFLRIAGGGGREFLPLPRAPASLTSAFGVAAAGTVGGRNTYNIQSRTVLAFRNARIRTSNAIASGLGWVVDDFVGEIDRNDRRYSGGLLWAPGSDIVGQRRIIGAGVGTQFDTRANPDEARAAPLVLFLAQPARVELLVDGRLVSAHAYEAGNQELDTSALSQGSYAVLLRIHERDGTVREERRFFVKDAALPPLGHPISFAYAGVLANTAAHRPVDPSGTLFYQAGMAWRLTNGFATDVDLLGTQRKAILEIGGWLLERAARLRVAALGSTDGDAGVLVQVSSRARRELNLSFDLRRIWSRDGGPLISLPNQIETFESDQPIGAQLARGSYTQAVASVGLRLGTGNLSVVGSYTRDADQRSDYSIGPSVEWPVVTRNGLQVAFQVSGQRSRSSTAAFAGIRLLSASGPVSLTASAGRSVERNYGDGPEPGGRSTGSVDVGYSRQTAGGGVLTLAAGAERDIESSTLRAGGTLTSQLGNARADVIHGVEGRAGTQYDVGFESGMAISSAGATFGARQPEPSAIIVSVHGDAPDARFTVLVDGAPRGQVRLGHPLSVFAAGYRTYQIRIVLADAGAVDYDGASREVTLYPGTVESLDWKAHSYFTLVAQAVAADGAPIANALVATPKAIGETDSNGFFQIDLRNGDAITIGTEGAHTCSVALPKLLLQQDFASVGKVICR